MTEANNYPQTVAELRERLRNVRCVLVQFYDFAITTEDMEYAIRMFQGADGLFLCEYNLDNHKQGTKVVFGRLEDD